MIAWSSVSYRIVRGSRRRVVGWSMMLALDGMMDEP